MTILWHSVKYPPKKDGIYYVRYKSTDVYDLRIPGEDVYNIVTLSYTTRGGWNTHRDFDGVCSESKYKLTSEDQWAEVEYVAD